MRSQAGRDPYDRNLQDLIGELSTRSDEFRVRWAAHNVRFHRTDSKRLHHPVVGEIHLSYETLRLDADEGLRNAALKDAAMAATRTKRSYLRALYERQRSRIGHGKAIGAVKHSMLVAAWNMLTHGQLYADLGPDYYRRRDPARTTKRLIAQLEALGHTVTLQQTAA